MGKHVIHISEDEAFVTNVVMLLAHVRAGAEIVIEKWNAGNCGSFPRPTHPMHDFGMHRVASEGLDRYHWPGVCQRRGGGR